MTLMLMACSEHDGHFGDGQQPELNYVNGEAVGVKVIDYCPAPGQFINEIPEYEDGDTQETMIAKAEKLLNDGYMISLGAWGGSVTLKLLSPIVNIADKDDFRVKGNAVYAVASVSGVRYGSAEPGIVLVMQDDNKNGLPDDAWYEIVGSETYNGVPDCEVTYYVPPNNASDECYIKWVSSTGEEGFLGRNVSYHAQSYFPLWLDGQTQMSFCGRVLPPNGYYNTETGKYDLISYYGYADSHPNNTDWSSLDISMAVDENGNKVMLSAIDFVKIYTGVLQSNGPLGECSTEVSGIEKLVY